MRNICMRLSYDGTMYRGFQTQPEHDTVQDRLESAIRMLTGESVKITSSGRTDAGVHARGQVVNFQSASQIPVERWCVAMNSRLPGDIVVWDASEVPESFHARRSAKTKTYRYTIRCGKHADPMRRRFEFHHYSPLDIEAMQHGLNYLLGQHEFTTFCSVRTASLSHVRTIFEAKLIADPVDEVLKSYALHLYVTGNGFLYNMVRIITGTILEVGQGRRSVESIGEILKAKNRAFAGPTAVPQGLMLWNVEY